MKTNRKRRFGKLMRGKGQKQTCRVEDGDKPAQQVLYAARLKTKIKVRSLSKCAQKRGKGELKCLEAKPDDGLFGKSRGVNTGGGQKGGGLGKQ